MGNKKESYKGEGGGKKVEGKCVNWKEKVKK